MEEIEEIQAMTNYARPVMTREEERKARLKMLEECRRMIDRWDEEDDARKAHEEETMDDGDLNLGVNHDGGSKESFSTSLKSLLVAQKNDEGLVQRFGNSFSGFNGDDSKSLVGRVEQYYERGKLTKEEFHGFNDTQQKEHMQDEDKWPETEMSNCAHQLFDQMTVRGKQNAEKKKKKKRWKLFADDVKHLEETLTGVGSVNSEILGIQMENTTKRQMKCLLELCKGVGCHWGHNRQRVGRKWLLLFRKNKRKRKRGHRLWR